jgi:alcohol dehydrogenase class IV
MRFEYFSVPRIVFGAGQLAQLGAIVRGLGARPLVLYNAGQRGDGGVADRCEKLLAAAGLHSLFLRQRGEPAVADVDAGAKLARENDCDCVLGLGGGSAIDAAKAVAALLANGGSALDYMEVVGAGRKLAKPAAPWVAVPTTAGTGAEVTRNAVITAPQSKFKASIRAEGMLARVALVDPELGLGVRPEVTARSGMDALCQCIESYTSNAAHAMSDALALRGVELAARSLRRAFADGADLEARTDMALCALISGMTLGNVGLGAVHGFAAPLGANYPVPHGAICGVLLPLVIEANVAALRQRPEALAVLAKYARVGRALAGDPSLDDQQAIERAIIETRAMVRHLRLPPLGDFGLTECDVPRLVELARKASSMRYNPVVLSDEALAGVLRTAIRPA